VACRRAILHCRAFEHPAQNMPRRPLPRFSSRDERHFAVARFRQLGCLAASSFQFFSGFAHGPLEIWQMFLTAA
jgi:hypothetical protein